MAPAWQQEELATKTTMMHNRTAEQSVEEGLENPLRFFANLLTVYVSRYCEQSTKMIAQGVWPGT
jgi:hypothetical protein